MDNKMEKKMYCTSGCGCEYPNGSGAHEFECVWKEMDWEMEFEQRFGGGDASGDYPSKAIKDFIRQEIKHAVENRDNYLLTIFSSESEKEFVAREEAVLKAEMAWNNLMDKKINKAIKSDRAKTIEKINFAFKELSILDDHDNHGHRKIMWRALDSIKKLLEGK